MSALIEETKLMPEQEPMCQGPFLNRTGLFLKKAGKCNYWEGGGHFFSELQGLQAQRGLFDLVFTGSRSHISCNLKVYFKSRQKHNWIQAILYSTLQ